MNNTLKERIKFYLLASIIILFFQSLFIYSRDYYAIKFVVVLFFVIPFLLYIGLLQFLNSSIKSKGKDIQRIHKISKLKLLYSSYMYLLIGILSFCNIIIYIIQSGIKSPMDLLSICVFVLFSLITGVKFINISLFKFKEIIFKKDTVQVNLDYCAQKSNTSIDKIKQLANNMFNGSVGIIDKKLNIYFFDKYFMTQEGVLGFVEDVQWVYYNIEKRNNTHINSSIKIFVNINTNDDMCKTVFQEINILSENIDNSQEILYRCCELFYNAYIGYDKEIFESKNYELLEQKRIDFLENEREIIINNGDGSIPIKYK